MIEVDGKVDLVGEALHQIDVTQCAGRRERLLVGAGERAGIAPAQAGDAGGLVVSGDRLDQAVVPGLDDLDDVRLDRRPRSGDGVAPPVRPII